MSFDWTSFLDMGGHGAYVWAAVAAVVLAMAAEVASLVLRDRDNASRAEPHEPSEETAR